MQYVTDKGPGRTFLNAGRRGKKDPPGSRRPGYGPAQEGFREAVMAP